MATFDLLCADDAPVETGEEMLGWVQVVAAIIGIGAQAGQAIYGAVVSHRTKDQAAKDAATVRSIQAKIAQSEAATSEARKLTDEEKQLLTRSLAILGGVGVAIYAGIKLTSRKRRSRR